MVSCAPPERRGHRFQMAEPADVLCLHARELALPHVKRVLADAMPTAQISLACLARPLLGAYELVVAECDLFILAFPNGRALLSSLRRNLVRLQIEHNTRTRS